MQDLHATDILGNSWGEAIGDELNKEYFGNLLNFLINERKNHTVYPPKGDVFNAFHLTPFHSVKVVILGQDPYHGPMQAHGLCFSVQKGVAPPPSLVNIFKEISDDIGCPTPSHGNLEAWAKQGVLLLNATLTVRAREAGSHQKKGWEEFTDAAIARLSSERKGLIFLLWGSYAQKKARLVDNSKHHLLAAPHPSPLSYYRGFVGCKHFSQTNTILTEQGEEPIEWEIR